MSGRSSKKSSTPAKDSARDRAAETKTFIDAVAADTSIDDITRKELMAGAQSSLNTFTASGQDQLKSLNSQLTALRVSQSKSQARGYRGDMSGSSKQIADLEKQIAAIQGAGSTFDTGAANLRKEFDLAKEGQAPKYRYRMFLQKKKEMLADRPGQSQLVLSGRG